MTSDSIVPAATPLPLRKILALCLIQLTEAAMITQIVPYLPFFIQELTGITDDTDPRIGTYTGFLAAMFPLAQTFSANVWGRLSDRIGRRPVILLGLLCNVIVIPLFGISSNLTMAFLFRALAGLVNGNVPVARTYLSSILDKTNQARGFSIVMMSFGVGVSVGPLLGGPLYDASIGISDEDNVFRRLPALLPCIAAASVSLFTLIVAYFVIDENTSRSQGSDRRINEPVPRSNESLDQFPRESDPSGSSSHSSSLLSARRSSSSEFGDRPKDSERRSDEQETSGAVYRELFRNSTWVMAVVMYFINSLNYIGFETLFPLWSKVGEASGGWEWPASRIAYVMSTAFAAPVVFQLFFLHRFTKRFGILRLFRFMAIAQSPFYLVWPLIASANALGAQVGLAVVASLFVKLTSSAMFTLIAMVLNNSVHLEVLGTSNGFAQAAASAARAVGPATIGACFALTLQYDVRTGTDVPFVNRNAMFYLLVIFNALSVVCSFRIPAKYNQPIPPQLRGSSKS